MKTQVFVFGDSIAFGEYDDDMGGWVARLNLALKKINPDVIVHNLSVSGELTDGTLKRFEADFSRRAEKGINTIIVFAVGINDTQRKNLLKTKRNIWELITRAKSFTDRVYWVGLTPVDPKKMDAEFDKHYDNDVIDELDGALWGACWEFAAYYISCGEHTPETWIDGLHPNAAGHEIIFEQVFKALKDKV